MLIAGFFGAGGAGLTRGRRFGRVTGPGTARECSVPSIPGLLIGVVVFLAGGLVVYVLSRAIYGKREPPNWLLGILWLLVFVVVLKVFAR